MPISFSSLVTANWGDKPTIAHICHITQVHWPHQFFDFPPPGTCWYPSQGLWESGGCLSLSILLLQLSKGSYRFCFSNMVRTISELWGEKLGCIYWGKQYEASLGVSINTPNPQRGWVELTWPNKLSQCFTEIPLSKQFSASPSVPHINPNLLPALPQDMWWLI